MKISSWLDSTTVCGAEIVDSLFDTWSNQIFIGDFTNLHFVLIDLRYCAKKIKPTWHNLNVIFLGWNVL